MIKYKLFENKQTFDEKPKAIKPNFTVQTTV